MEDTRSKFEWTLYDPNGNQAGEGKMAVREGTDDYQGTIASQGRSPQHMIPFDMAYSVYHPTNVEETRVTFVLNKQTKGCDCHYGSHWEDESACYPRMVTENKPETEMFLVNTCYQCCKDPKDAKLCPADMNCQVSKIVTNNCELC